jgi:hypothetical protein
VTKRDFIGFEVVRAVVMKSPACHLLHAGFLPGPFFNPEDGDHMFLQNVSLLSVGYTVLYPGI